MRGSPEQPSREHSVTTGQGDASQHGRDASSSGEQIPWLHHPCLIGAPRNADPTRPGIRGFGRSCGSCRRLQLTHSYSGSDDHTLRCSAGFPGYYHGTTRSGSESALQTSFDPSKLMSTAVQHGSEAGNERSALNTQASLLEEELEGELQEGEAPGTDEPMLTARPSPTQAELESMHIGSSRVSADVAARSCCPHA